MIEISLSEFFHLLIYIATPILLVASAVSGAVNLLLATIQLQEQSISAFLKLTVIFCFVYFWGSKNLEQIRDSFTKNITRIEYVGHNSSLSP